jgi:hypothetical protein
MVGKLHFELLTQEAICREDLGNMISDDQMTLDNVTILHYHLTLIILYTCRSMCSLNVEK